jgi:poly(A) polymerase
LGLLFNKKSSIPKPLIIPRDQHCISRHAISKNALKVLYHLNKNGFQAYLVGGSVRDILLGKRPKDFDVATDAHPEQIKKLFRNCLLIGKRFRIAHIRFSHETIEVTTFRAQDSGKKNKNRLMSAAGMLLRDNVYGSIHEDATRRDFSMNALYYNIQDFTLVDYCNGLEDIAKKRIRMIGNPEQRFQEDPVRILRAIRLAAKFDNFRLDSETEQALIAQKALLTHVPGNRLFDEILKLFHSGYALNTYHLLKQYKLFELLFPALAEYMDNSEYNHWIETACQNTDARILEQKTVSPAFWFATALWIVVKKETQKHQSTSASPAMAYQKAIKHTIEQQQYVTPLTRLCSQMMREIWLLQPALIQRHPQRVKRLLLHPRLRAAYDFLLLRAQCDEIPNEIGQWWTTLLASDEKQKESMLHSRPLPRVKRKNATRQ